VLTVDLPVAGRRERELRHGEFAFPEGIALTSHLGDPGERHQAPIGGYDTTLTWPDVGWAAAASGLPVIVKGVLCAHDAELALDAGAAAIVVSNHGGRQVDGCVPTAVALRDVADAVGGHVPVLVDGGIRDGADVLRALALGADAVLVGRPYAWGLACGGEAGVRAVLDAFADDLRRALALAGCPALRDVDAARVRFAGW
jgi:4-hydroxymandelate oxidase